MKFIDTRHDRWHTIAGDDGPRVSINPAPFSLLTQLQWNSVRAHWPADVPVGVIAPNDIDIESLEADLPRIALVVLQFPKWVDGRAYSQAHVLRSRLRYAGEVRATGDVLVDMMLPLQRTGFDAVAMRADQSLQAAERALDFFPGHYQGDVHDPRPRFARSVDEAIAPKREFVHGGASI
jgi:uncharacterized protein (DUF934 family)